RLVTDHAHGDRDKLMTDDGDVHRFIYKCASNPYLESTLDTYLNLGLRLCYLVLDRWTELPDEIAGHTELLDALEAGDADRASTLMRQHIENCARSIEKAL